MALSCRSWTSPGQRGAWLSSTCRAGSRRCRGDVRAHLAAHAGRWVRPWRAWPASLCWRCGRTGSRPRRAPALSTRRGAPRSADAHDHQSHVVVLLGAGGEGVRCGHQLCGWLPGASPAQRAASRKKRSSPIPPPRRSSPRSHRRRRPRRDRPASARRCLRHSRVSPPARPPDHPPRGGWWSCRLDRSAARRRHCGRVHVSIIRVCGS